MAAVSCVNGGQGGRDSSVIFHLLLRQSTFPGAIHRGHTNAMRQSLAVTPYAWFQLRTVLNAFLLLSHDDQKVDLRGRSPLADETVRIQKIASARKEIVCGQDEYLHRAALRRSSACLDA
ncbi:hypothetical protein [Caballeronia choica]|uniref:hypothetical protein n=1 Tax=Caballeronia choica TaxID=326476 RepID=UPI00190E854B|nr:hypothetical protein [Caballeronia choica]